MRGDRAATSQTLFPGTRVIISEQDAGTVQREEFSHPRAGAGSRDLRCRQRAARPWLLLVHRRVAFRSAGDGSMDCQRE